MEQASRQGRRRAILRSVGALVAGAGAAVSRAAARPDPLDFAADVDPGAVLVRLVQRITFGMNAVELELARSLGYYRYLEHHLNPEAMDEQPLMERLKGLRTVWMSFNELVGNMNFAQMLQEYTEAAVLRAALSPRQLHERLVEMWQDHFNIDVRNDGNIYLHSVHDREVIRRHAMGTFPALLSAVCRSPAMLHYLDNDVSTADRPVENFARELLELHTVGVDAYTQQDVVEVARCFTGWSWYRSGHGELNGTFAYRPEMHDDGDKVVLGVPVPTEPEGDGMSDGERVIRILAEHPATSRTVARRICHTFLGESCPDGIIEHVAAVYRRTRGDIREMLRAALASNLLADAKPKFKRPFHFTISAIRVLPTTIYNSSGLRDRLDEMGHRPFYWTAPDGYPDTTSYWHAGVLARWNFGAMLVQGQVPGLEVDSESVFRDLNTAAEMARRINARLFAGEMPTEEEAELASFMEPVYPYPPGRPQPTEQWEALGLAIGSPQFQWY